MVSRRGQNLPIAQLISIPHRAAATRATTTTPSLLLDERGGRTVPDVRAKKSRVATTLPTGGDDDHFCKASTRGKPPAPTFAPPPPPPLCPGAWACSSKHTAPPGHLALGCRYRAGHISSRQQPAVVLPAAQSVFTGSEACPLIHCSLLTTICVYALFSCRRRQTTRRGSEPCVCVDTRRA